MPDMDQLLFLNMINEHIESSTKKTPIVPAPIPMPKKDKKAFDRLSSVRKVYEDLSSSRYECHAALLTACEQWKVYWPSSWLDKEKHYQLIDECVSAAEHIMCLYTRPAQVATMLDNTLIVQDELDTGVACVLRGLLKRIAQDTLLDMARAESKK